MVEHVAAEAGDVEIGPAVVVDVAHGAAHGEAGRSDAGFGGDVGEGAVVIVMEERASGLLALERHLYCGRVGEVNVGPAVAVVIDDQDAAAHRFHDVLLLRRG